jgi:hypothetical protein
MMGDISYYTGVFLLLSHSTPHIKPAFFWNLEFRVHFPPPVQLTLFHRRALKHSSSVSKEAFAFQNIS